MRLLYNKICGTQQKLYFKKNYSFKCLQRPKLNIIRVRKIQLTSARKKEIKKNTKERRKDK